MLLTLNIVSGKHRSTEDNPSQTVNQGSISIGRSPNNDWTLDDPEMVLSREHCIINYRDDGYYLTDTSQNGVFINQNPQQVGQNNTIKLSHNDQLKLGDYVIHVNITDQASATPGSTGGTWTDLLAHPAMEGVDTTGTRHSITQTPDPLTDTSAHDLGIHSSPVEPLPDQLEQVQDTDPLGLNNSDNSESRLWPQPSEADHVPVEQEYYRPPEPELEPPQEPEPTPSSIIPDDLDDDSLIKKIKRSELSDIMPPEVAKDDPDEGLSDLSEPPFSETEKISAQKPVHSEPPAADQIEPIAEPEHARDPLPAPTTTPKPVAPISDHPNQVDGRQALLPLLQGAGLEHLNIPPQHSAQLLYDVGVILRLSVQGMMDVLRARSEIRRENRIVDQTTISQNSNNPLKHLPTVEQVLGALLVDKNPSWLPANKAVNESFNDLKRHELAMNIAMQKVLRHYLNTFDPEQFEQDQQESSKLERLTGNRKAKCWDAFKQRYQHLTEDDSHATFQVRFANAYEQAQRELDRR